MKSPIRILAVDGGGVGGIIPARIIERLAQADSRLIGQADLVAGTSTGGLIALGLGKGLSPADLCALYQNKCKDIFSAANRRPLVEHAFRAKFAPDGLRDAVNAIVGNLTLGQLTAKPVLVPVTAVQRPDGKHQPAGIFLSTAFRLINDPTAEKYASSRWPSIDVALATSAAPSFFPAYEVDDPDGHGRWICWDGGIVANNPALAAVGEVLRLHLKEQNAKVREDPSQAPDIRVLTFGTGYRDLDIEAGDWGLIQTPRPLISALLDTSVGSTAFLLRQLLGTRAVRVSVPLSQDYAIDDPSVVDQLNEVAIEFATNQLGSVQQPDGSSVNLPAWLQQFWFSP